MEASRDCQSSQSGTVIQCSGGIRTKPDDSQSEGNSLTKLEIFATAVASPKTLMPFKKRVS